MDATIAADLCTLAALRGHSETFSALVAAGAKPTGEPVAENSKRVTASLPEHRSAASRGTFDCNAMHAAAMSGDAATLSAAAGCGLLDVKRAVREPTVAIGVATSQNEPNAMAMRVRG